MQPVNKFAFLYSQFNLKAPIPSAEARMQDGGVKQRLHLQPLTLNLNLDKVRGVDGDGGVELEEERDVGTGGAWRFKTCTCSSSTIFAATISSLFAFADQGLTKICMSVKQSTSWSCSIGLP
nr:hypothetical protein Itr_chr04CG12790 [Ipomoea trifida]